MRIKTLVSVKLGKSRPGVYFSSISQTQIRDNKILSRRRSVFFFRVFYRNLALLNLSVLLLPFIALLQNTHTTLAEMVKV